MLETFFSLTQVKHEITPLKQKAAEIPHIRLTRPSVTELLARSPVRLQSYFFSDS